MNLPYFITDFRGVGGVIKQRPEDFFVDELPLYEPAGKGEHVIAEIEKVGVSTLDAVAYIARQLDVPVGAIGYAGLKDRRAVARQRISIGDVTPEQLMSLKSDRITVRWAERHENKLRIGHLAGNRFVVRIRDVDPMKVVTLRPVLQTLCRRGVPNYFGEQRFGRRQNNDRLGAAFMRGDDREVLRLLLGDPRPGFDEPDELRARSLFAAGQYNDSLVAWPRPATAERRVLVKLIKTEDAHAAVMAVDATVRRLWVSALQSRMFNEVVADRIGSDSSIDKVVLGDLAYRHDSGACFAVTDEAAERPRAEAFDISPSGPMIGRRLSLPSGRPLEVEQRLFHLYEVSPDDFRSKKRDRSPGARRPLRVRPTDTRLESGVDEHGPHITIAFTLPAGAYATVLLRELMRNDTEQYAAPSTPADAEHG